MCMTPKYTKACYITARLHETIVSASTIDVTILPVSKLTHLLAMLSSHLNTFESISSLFLSLIVVDTRCIKSLANPLTAVVSCPCDGRI